VEPPHGDLDRPGPVADRPDGARERRVRVDDRIPDRRRRQVAEGPDQRQDGRLLEIDRQGDGRAAEAGPAPPVSACLPGGAALGAIGAGQGRDEALQVADSIAPVTARVDPVIAQPPGIAPGADRIRMDAKDVRGPGDGERRVDRPRAKRSWRRH